MNLAQHIAAGYAPGGINLMLVMTTPPQPHHLKPVAGPLQVIRRVIEPRHPSDDLPTHSTRQRQVLELVQERGKVSYADIASALGVSIQNARQVVLLMRERGRLERNFEDSPWTFSMPATMSGGDDAGK